MPSVQSNTRTPGLLKLFTTALNLMRLHPEVREILLSYQHKTKTKKSILRLEEWNKFKPIRSNKN